MFTFKLQGQLTRDPETRSLKNGSNITTISVACPIAKNKEVLVMFADLKAWSPLAEKLAALRKGSRIFAEGEGITDKYEKDGKTHYKTAFWPFHVQTSDAEAGDSGSQTSSPSSVGAKPRATIDSEADVPF